MPAGLDTDSVVVAASDHLASNLGDETVILSLPKGAYFGLNDVGSVIWERLQRPVSVGELSATVRQTFDVAEADAEAHLLMLLSDMLAAGLVQVVKG